MKQLTQILQSAIQEIDGSYFSVQLDGGSPVYRERVYCYELYHQLRKRWPLSTNLRLNGELDKSAHPILEELAAAYAKPDLLVHTPGCMEGNNTIIEVKSQRASRKEIKKDLNTLNLFLTKVGYRRAIYLIYGYNAENVALRVQNIAKDMEISNIELWLHVAPGEKVTIEKLGI